MVHVPSLISETRIPIVSDSLYCILTPFLRAPVLIRKSVAVDDFRMSACARFRDAPLRSIVRINDAESFRVPSGPIEVVEQAPHLIAPEVYALLNQKFCFRNASISST